MRNFAAHQCLGFSVGCRDPIGERIHSADITRFFLPTACPNAHRGEVYTSRSPLMLMRTMGRVWLEAATLAHIERAVLLIKTRRTANDLVLEKKEP